MSKAVLVMDMPESCSKCNFAYEFQGIKKCHILNQICNGGKAILAKDKYAEEVSSKCLFKLLPEKMQVYGTYPQPDGIVASYKVGYNACIDEILREG